MILINKTFGSYNQNNEGYSVKENTNPICIACNPKYRPRMSAETNYAIDDCIEIANCSESNTFNRCEKCSDGYSLIDIRGQQCVESVEKCLFSNIEGTECQQCYEGYNLNVDKKCDKIETYDCEQYGYYSDQEVLENHLQMSFSGLGCQKCS